MKRTMTVAATATLMLSVGAASAQAFVTYGPIRQARTCISATFSGGLVVDRKVPCPLTRRVCVYRRLLGRPILLGCHTIIVERERR